MLGMLGMRNSRSGAMHIHAGRYASTIQVSCSHNSHCQYLQILSFVPLVESLNNCYLPHFFPLYQILRIFHRFKWQIQKRSYHTHPLHHTSALPYPRTPQCVVKHPALASFSFQLKNRSAGETSVYLCLFNCKRFSKFVANHQFSNNGTLDSRLKTALWIQGDHYPLLSTNFTYHISQSDVKQLSNICNCTNAHTFQKEAHLSIKGTCQLELAASSQLTHLGTFHEPPCFFSASGEGVDRSSLELTMSRADSNNNFWNNKHTIQNETWNHEVAWTPM